MIASLAQEGPALTTRRYAEQVEKRKRGAPAPAVSRLQGAARAKARERALKTLLFQPEYVQACWKNIKDTGKTPYFVHTWQPLRPTERKRMLYSCRSWRCAHCARGTAAVMFARLRQAFEPLGKRGVSFWVLTLHPDFHRRGAKFESLRDVYRTLGKKVELLRRRISYELERRGMAPLGSEWASTVEAHRSGVPHVNLVIHHAGLAELLRADHATRTERTAVARTLLRGEFRRHALACGFGVRCSAEAARDGSDALEGYLTKTAGNDDETHGEVAKLCQVPRLAPRGFRRLRSGKGFLPKRKRSGNTGCILRRVRTNEGDSVVMPVTRLRPLAELRADLAALRAQLLAPDAKPRQAESALRKCVALTRAIDRRPGYLAAVGTSIAIEDALAFSDFADEQKQQAERESSGATRKRRTARRGARDAGRGNRPNRVDAAHVERGRYPASN